MIEPSVGRLAFAQMAGDRLFQEFFKEGVIELGRMVMTPGAEEALHDASQIPAEFLIRHKNGDWGELDPDDRAENERSVREGYRVVSSYRTKKQENSGRSPSTIAA